MPDVSLSDSKQRFSILKTDISDYNNSQGTIIARLYGELKVLRSVFVCAGCLKLWVHHFERTTCCHQSGNMKSCGEKIMIEKW